MSLIPYSVIPVQDWPSLICPNILRWFFQGQRIMTRWMEGLSHLWRRAKVSARMSSSTHRTNFYLMSIQRPWISSLKYTRLGNLYDFIFVFTYLTIFRGYFYFIVAFISFFNLFVYLKQSLFVVNWPPTCRASASLLSHWYKFLTSDLRIFNRALSPAFFSHRNTALFNRVGVGSASE